MDWGLKYIAIFCLTITSVNFTNSALAFPEEKPAQMEIIIIDEDAVLERFNEYTFTTGAGVKKLLGAEGVIPTTTDWMEVTLLCEKLYSHLQNEKYLCIYKYSKIMDQYEKSKKYCNHTSQTNEPDQAPIKDEDVYKKCMTKYGFSDATSWKSFKDPLKKSKPIEASAEQPEAKTKIKLEDLTEDKKDEENAK